MFKQVILLTALLLSSLANADVNIGTRESHRWRHNQNKKRTHPPARHRRTGAAAENAARRPANHINVVIQQQKNYEKPLTINRSIASSSKGIATTASSGPALTLPARTSSHGWSKAVGRSPIVDIRPATSRKKTPPVKRSVVFGEGCLPCPWSWRRQNR